MQRSSIGATARTRQAGSTTHIFATAIAAALGLSATARADLWWDSDGAAAGGTSGTVSPNRTATGTWGTNNFWSTSAAGDVATGGWTAGETAVFSAGTDVVDAYTVTLGSAQDAGGLRFEEGTVTLSGAGLTLSGAAPTVTLGATGATGGANVQLTTALTAANEVTFLRGHLGLANINLNAANAFAAGVRLGTTVRLNANAAGALGAGTITFDGTESSITNNANATSFTFSNNVLLNPSNAAGFVAGFAGAGGTAANIATVNFAGNITSGNDGSNLVDVYISPTPQGTNNATNGNGVTVFSGNNNYSGRTVINLAGGGAFRLGSATALPHNKTHLVFGRPSTTSGQNVGLMDLNGQNITVLSLRTDNAAGTTVAGLTNANGAAGGNVTVTGGETTTFSAPIGAVTNNALNVATANAGGTNNLSLTLSDSHTGRLTLSGANTYTGVNTVDGGTLINGRQSLTANGIAGDVVVNDGGTFGSTATIKSNEYGVGGNITVNGGGTLAPGISSTSLVGTSTVRAGSLTANGGSKLDFTLFSAANHDVVEVTGGLTLGAGTKTIDVTLVGDTFVATPGNPLVLMTYASLTADPGDGFTLGADPGDTNPDFVYTLTTEPTRVILTAMPTTTTLAWDADAAGGTLADGAGTWRDGGAAPHYFTDIVTGAETPWGNANNFNTIIGASSGGAGGVVALDGNIRTGGRLTFNNVATAYTIGDVGETDTLTVAGGVTNNAVGTVINAPLVLEASQTFNITDGTGSNSLIVNGAVTEASAGQVLTKIGGGTLTFNGAVGVGGLTVNGTGTTAVASTAGNTIGAITQSAGTIQISGVNTVGSVTMTGGTIQMNTDGALGTAPISINSATLRANVTVNMTNAIDVGAGGATLNVQTGADSTYSGNITGAGGIAKAGSGKLTLTGNNTFNGLLIGGVGAGVAVGSDAALGVGPIAINGSNTLNATNSFTTDNAIVTAPTAGNRSHINTGGFTLTLNGVISGVGDIAHRGGGRLVLGGANTYSGDYEFADAGGTLETTSLTALGSGNIVATVSGTVETTADLNLRDITGTATANVTKTGAANATVRRVRDIGTLAIHAGRITVSPHGAGTGTSKVQALQIAAGAQLHLNDNDVLIDYPTAGPSPEAQIRQYVKDGRTTGSTSGIFSTPGNPDDDKVLAIADNAAWNKTELNGVEMDLSTVVGKYTYFGDANLDGKVTGDDYLNVDANLGTGDSWLEGDFNMSGQTTGDDYLAIDANLGKGTPTPLAFAELKEEMVALHVAMFGEEYLVKLARVEAEGFGASVVPEPGMAGVVAVAGAALLTRRRRGAPDDKR